MVSIILPTYNEAENIVDLISQIRKLKFEKQIIVVDDNSGDGTALLVKKRNWSDVLVEVRSKDRGLTNSIKRGIELARGDVIVWMDSDFSMPPVLIPKLIAKTSEGFDIAVGSRFVKGGGFRRGKNDFWLAIVLSRLMNFSIQFLLGREFRDYTSGFVASRRIVFKKIKLRGDYGEYFIDFIYRARILGFKIVEIGYICLPRRAGETKTGQNLWQYFLRGSKYMAMTFRLLISKV